MRNLTWCLVRNIFQTNNLTRNCILSQRITLFRHNIRGYDTVVSSKRTNNDYHEVKSYKQFLDETSIGYGRAAVTLMKTLDVTRENAVTAVKLWKAFGGLSKLTLIENNRILRERGVNKSTLRDNMYALADTTQNIIQKIQSIESTKLEINSAIPLFQLSAATLATFARTTINDRAFIPNYNNRIEYFVRQLNCDTYTFCNIVCSRTFMLHLKIQKLVEITSFLLNAGISGEHILNDLIIYQYSTERIKSRVERAVRAKITPLKPWVVRCPMHVIENAEARNISKEFHYKSAKTREEYVSQVMDCDIESVKALFKRDPKIHSINIEKLAKILKVLRQAGYTICDIYRVPRCLHYNDETIEKNYNTWCEHKSLQPALATITSSRANFYKKLKISQPQIK